MRLLVLGDFSRDPEPLTQGSDIRAHYISTELETEGFKVERVSRDLVPHSRTARRQLARLPVLIRHSDAVLIVGIPRRLLIYRLLTRLQAGRIPIILDFNDDPILQSIALGERSIPHESGTKRMIDEIVRCSSLVVFVSESMRSFYLNLWRERNLNPQMDTLVVPNASDPSHFAPSPVPKEPTLGYVGGLAVGRGFEMLVKAVEILRSEGRPVRLRIGVSMSDATNVSRNSGLKPRSWIEFVTGVNFQTVPSERPHLHYPPPQENLLRLRPPRQAFRLHGGPSPCPRNFEHGTSQTFRTNKGRFDHGALSRVFRQGGSGPPGRSGLV
jgi:glycosyltransferase involved in cell wall biosynthesis